MSKIEIEARAAHFARCIASGRLTTTTVRRTVLGWPGSPVCPNMTLADAHAILKLAGIDPCGYGPAGSYGRLLPARRVRG